MIEYATEDALLLDRKVISVEMLDDVTFEDASFETHTVEYVLTQAEDDDYEELSVSDAMELELS